MTEFTFSQAFLIFIIYSMLGWVCESIWCSIGAKKLVKRGFLFGPWCPIYGFGAVFVLFFAAPVQKQPLLVFLVSLAATTLLEYFTGWLLETLFQTQWWDYSNRRFNLKGRICLRNSLLFGIMGLALIYLVHPFVNSWLLALNPQTRRVISSVALAVFLLDFICSLVVITGLKKRMQKLRVILAELEEYQEDYTWFNKGDVVGSIIRLREICQSENAGEQALEILKRIDSLERRHSTKRLIEAFPTMKPKGFTKELKLLRHEWGIHQWPHRRKHNEELAEDEKKQPATNKKEN